MNIRPLPLFALYPEFSLPCIGLLSNFRNLIQTTNRILSMKTKPYISFILLLLGVSLVLFLIHFSLINWVMDPSIFFYPVWGIYLFHFLITSAIFSILFFVGKNFPNYIGFSFMGLILFKMIAAIVFLLPLIRMKDVSKIPDFISFFAPYFIFLVIEILLTMKILKISEEENSTNSTPKKNNTA